MMRRKRQRIGSRRRYLVRVERQMQKMLGVGWDEALRMYEAGDLEGTLAHVLIFQHKWMLA